MYNGLDTSLNPGMGDKASVIHAAEQLHKLITGDNSFYFGRSGSVALAQLFTSIVKAVEVKQVGYCGFMIPVLEDTILAKRWSERRLTTTSLLALSAVCGVGIDTVPLANNVYKSQAAVRSVYEDLIALATVGVVNITTDLDRNGISHFPVVYLLFQVGIAKTSNGMTNRCFRRRFYPFYKSKSY